MRFVGESRGADVTHPDLDWAQTLRPQTGSMLTNPPT